MRHGTFKVRLTWNGDTVRSPRLRSTEAELVEKINDRVQPVPDVYLRNPGEAYRAAVRDINRGSPPAGPPPLVLDVLFTRGEIPAYMAETARNVLESEVGGKPAQAYYGME